MAKVVLFSTTTCSWHRRAKGFWTPGIALATR
jgi:hypothetical protein